MFRKNKSKHFLLTLLGNNLLLILILLISVAVSFNLINRKNISIKKTFSIDTIENKNIKAKAVLIATGDVIPARSVNFMISNKVNPTWPFEKIKDFLKAGDITLVNLETPLIQNCPITNEGFKFCGDYKNIQGLEDAGVDIVNIANNHIGNYGEEGIRETEKLITSRGMLISGTNDISYKNVNGINFAFVGFNDVGGPINGVLPADDNLIKNKVLEAKKIADIVVVSFHWGIEYTSQADERQVYLAHLAVDSGADLVIGNHPHWIQNSEWYKGKYIKYAHGNLVFDQMWSEETKKGVIGTYTFEGNKLVDVQYTPVYIENYGQPKIIN